MKYIWLNPIVTESYDMQILLSELHDLGYTPMYPIQNHLEDVTDEYKQLSTHKTIIDRRCPLAFDAIQAACTKYHHPVANHDIEPILIHIAREFAARKDLKDSSKLIITPCISLKDMGIRLHLDDTTFMTWDEFVKQNAIKTKGHKLGKSPIPFGFFKNISKHVMHVTSDNMNDLKNLENTEIIEGLYCDGGCQNGDGVTTIEN